MVFLFTPVMACSGIHGNQAEMLAKSPTWGGRLRSECRGSGWTRGGVERLPV